MKRNTVLVAIIINLVYVCLWPQRVSAAAGDTNFDGAADTLNHAEGPIGGATVTITFQGNPGLGFNYQKVQSVTSSSDPRTKGLFVFDLTVPITGFQNPTTGQFFSGTLTIVARYIVKKVVLMESDPYTIPVGWTGGTVHLPIPNLTLK